MKPSIRNRSTGFTLIEMAVVVAVIGLLLGSLLIPLATQVEERRLADVRRTLEDAREALLGFAMANGRLPCPATGTSYADENPLGGGACTNNYNGFLPASLLGVSPTDAQGYAIDPWGNRIRYAVTATNANAYTSNLGISNQFTAGTLTPDLQVCSTSFGVSGAPPSCAFVSRLTDRAVAVIFSTGPNGATNVGDEAENNASNDRLFISRIQTRGLAGGDFDDIVTWLSPNVLYNRMVAAGRLP